MKKTPTAAVGNIIDPTGGIGGELGMVGGEVGGVVVHGSLSKVGAKAAAAGIKGLAPTATTVVANVALKSLSQSEVQKSFVSPPVWVPLAVATETTVLGATETVVVGGTAVGFSTAAVVSGGLIIVGGIIYIVVTAPPSIELPHDAHFERGRGDINTLPNLPANSPANFPKYETKPADKPVAPEPDRPQTRIKQFYATYTKTDEHGKVYSGMTSGYYTGSAPTREDADRIVAARDKRHHINLKGTFAEAKTERYHTSKFAIRGREQQLIDF